MTRFNCVRISPHFCCLILFCALPKLWGLIKRLAQSRSVGIFFVRVLYSQSKKFSRVKSGKTTHATISNSVFNVNGGSRGVMKEIMSILIHIMNTDRSGPIDKEKKTLVCDTLLWSFRTWKRREWSLLLRYWHRHQMQDVRCKDEKDGKINSHFTDSIWFENAT